MLRIHTELSLLFQRRKRKLPDRKLLRMQMQVALRMQVERLK